MQVIVKKNVLEQLVKRLAEERSFHSRRYDQIAGDEKPVMPDAQIAMQLSTDKVPVEDPDFLPVNKKQLATAASQISQDVTPREIQKFYKGLKKLLRQTSEPKQYKGMSETDLMEALRPLVIREARRVASVDTTSPLQGYSSDDADDVDDPGEGTTVDTGIKIGSAYEPEPAEIERAEKESPPASRGKKDSKGKSKESEDQREMTPEEIFRDSLRASALKAEELRKNMVEKGKKIPLESVIVGDVNKLHRAFENAGLKRPKSLAEANVEINFESRTIPPGKKFDLPYVNISIRFIDKGKRPDLNLEPAYYDGGATEVTAEYAGGRKEDMIYYVVADYPFTKEKYVEIFEKLLPIEADRINMGILKKLTEPKGEEDDEKEKKKRSATIQKKLSVVNSKEMAFEIIAKLEDFKNNNDTNSIDAVFKRLKMPDTAQQFMSMSDDDKTRLHARIATQLEDQRTSFYDISHMDYVRDIIDSDEFESEYEASIEEVVSTNPTSVLEERILETFFNACLDPTLDSLTKELMKTVIKVNLPEEQKEFQQVINTYFNPDSYEQFLSSGVEKSEWKDLVNDITKEALTKSKIFAKTIPDFARMYKGVKGKEGTEEYDERLSAIGMKEIGRQREPFEHIRSLVALSRAVVTSAMLDHLDPEESDVLENSMIKIEKIRSNFRKILTRASESLQAAALIMSEPSYRNAIQKAGIPDYFELHLAPVDDTMSKLEDTGVFEKMEKASQTRALDIPGTREYIDLVSDSFIEKCEKYFSSLSGTDAMSEVYDFISRYAVDVAVNAPEEDIISDTADGIARLAAKKKKGAEEARKLSKKKS